MCRLSWNQGTSSSWNTQGLSRSVMRLLYVCMYMCVCVYIYTYTHTHTHTHTLRSIRPRFLSTSITCWPSKMKAVQCFEISLSDNPLTQRHIPEQRNSGFLQLLYGTEPINHRCMVWARAGMLNTQQINRRPVSGNVFCIHLFHL